MEFFQERLRQCREGVNKTQAEIADELEFSYRTYCRYERGGADPTLTALIKLADYFHVSIDYLAGRTDDPAPPTAPGAVTEKQEASGE